MESYFVTVRVDTQESMPPESVTRLVQRLLDAGLADAGNSPTDWSDPDKERIDLITGVAANGATRLGGNR